MAYRGVEIMVGLVLELGSAVRETVITNDSLMVGIILTPPPQIKQMIRGFLVWFCMNIVEGL